MSLDHIEARVKTGPPHSEEVLTNPTNEEEDFTEVEGTVDPEEEQMYVITATEWDIGRKVV